MTQPLPSSIGPLSAVAAKVASDEGSLASEQRNEPRITLLIRAAKLIAGDDEFLVVLRDVSREGLKVKTFHPLPADEPLAIELASGERHQIEEAWQEGEISGFRFRDPVALERLLADSPMGKRKRPVRVRLSVPVKVFAGARRCDGTFIDISQNGACMSSDHHLALDERIRIEGPGLPELTGRVRWRRTPLYGLIFEQTFRLDDLARMTAHLAAAEG